MKYRTDNWIAICLASLLLAGVVWGGSQDWEKVWRNFASKRQISFQTETEEIKQSRTVALTVYRKPPRTQIVSGQCYTSTAGLGEILQVDQKCKRIKLLSGVKQENLIRYENRWNKVKTKVPIYLMLRNTKAGSIALGRIGETDYYMEQQASQACSRMLQDAYEAGMGRLVVTSAFRTSEKQQELFERKVKQLEEDGEEQPWEAATFSVAIPGTSEHEQGFAVDIGVLGLGENIDWTEDWKWLDQHAADYGFILRYPKNKVHLTHCKYEPWHFRYVGQSAAQFMKNSDLCLEEIYDSLYFKLQYIID